MSPSPSPSLSPILPPVIPPPHTTTDNTDSTPAQPHLPRFSSENPIQWISQAERYFEFYAIYDDDRFPYVVDFFDDEPFYWFNSWYREFECLTWKSFTTAMLTTFPPVPKTAPTTTSKHPSSVVPSAPKTSHTSVPKQASKPDQNVCLLPVPQTDPSPKPPPSPASLSPAHLLLPPSTAFHQPPPVPMPENSRLCFKHSKVNSTLRLFIWPTYSLRMILHDQSGGKTTSQFNKACFHVNNDASLACFAKIREWRPPWQPPSRSVVNTPNAFGRVEWRPPWAFIPSLRTRTFFRAGVLIRSGFDPIREHAYPIQASRPSPTFPQSHDLVHACNWPLIVILQFMHYFRIT